MSVSFAVFDTAFGPCAAAWCAAGLVRVQLPEGDADQARRRMLSFHPHAEERAPAGGAAEAVARIGRLLETGREPLADLALDWSAAGAFEREVYRLTLEVGPGETTTYGDIARKLGDVALSRRVGQALGRNPWPIVVPCHRVLGAGGRVGGFSAPGGVDTKMRLLELERAHAAREPALFSDLPLAVRPRGGSSAG